MPPKKKYKKWTENNMTKVRNVIENDKVSYKNISQMFDIPKSKLHRYANNTSPCQPVLTTYEEDQIIS